MSKKHMGSSIDDFLKKEGIFEEAQAEAIKEVVAWQLAWLTKGRGVWSDFDLLVATIIISVAVSQALLALGDNSRYAIGVEPLIFYLYCATAWRLAPACGKLLKHENTPQRR